MSMDGTNIVETFDPASAAALSVTERAQQHIRAQLLASGQSYLRLGVSESGCNGFMYTLDYTDTPTDADHAFNAGDVTIYVASEHLPMVGGTEVDLVTEGLNSSLKFKNPNAESHCGCGESFSVKPADSASPEH